MNHTLTTLTNRLKLFLCCHEKVLRIPFPHMMTSEKELCNKWQQLHVHEQTAQLRCLMTTISSRDTSRSDWVFYADRVNRLMVEFALNFLPVDNVTVTTPVDNEQLHGLAFAGSIVGVSIIRAGEAMETALRSCCRNVRIGKILIQRNENTAQPVFYMAKLPPDIASRHVLLLDPMLATGGSAIVAIEKLLQAGVKESNIVFVSVVAAPEGINALLSKHPNIDLCTASVAVGLNEKSFIRKSLGDYGDRCVDFFRPLLSNSITSLLFDCSNAIPVPNRLLTAFL